MSQPPLSALPRRHLLALTASLLLALPSWAQPALQMQLIDRASGQPLTTYAKDGRLFNPGQPGARYAIRLRNASPERVLVVLSVDGVNVVSGETANWNQTGYVLGPWQSADISGWRKSDRQVAAFEFARLSDSYAARTGRPDHVGVIGAAVFQEALPPEPVVMSPPQPLGEARERASADLSSQSAAKSAAPAAQATERLGTGHGQREWSPVQRTAFERRSSQPALLQQIWYDSAANLIAAGVMPAPVVASVPRAFPANPGYVPDPPPRRW